MNFALEADVPRWEQRLSKLNEVMEWVSALRPCQNEALSEIACQGWIQVFERCHDLAWVCLRDYLVWQGSPDQHGPRDVIRECIARGILRDGERWMDMNASRALALKSHHRAVAQQLCERILSDYLPLLFVLRRDLQMRTSA